MKKFKFSLDAVLNWKRTQAEDALKTMAACMRKRQEAYHALEIARRHMGALLQTMRQARTGTVSSWTQVAYLREVTRQEGLCQKATEAYDAAIQAENRAREAYLACRQEAETIEKLKDKRHETYQKEADRKLEQELEEIMLSRIGNSLCR